jgi:hypothetical protein
MDAGDRKGKSKAGKNVMKTSSLCCASKTDVKAGRIQIIVQAASSFEAGVCYVLPTSSSLS